MRILFSIIIFFAFLYASTSVFGDHLLVTATEVGDDVVLFADGTVDLSGLGAEGSSLGTEPSFIDSDELGNGLFLNGLQGGSRSLFFLSSEETLPVFGNGDSQFATSSSGTSFGFFQSFGQSGGRFIVETSALNGNNIATITDSTSTYANSTFASLGLDEGTYVATWSSGSVTLQVGSVAIPEPASISSFAILALACLSFRRRS